MSPAENTALHILHVFSAIGLVGTIFFASAGPPESRKKLLGWSGAASLLVILTALRLWQGLYNFSGGWPIVKIFCWLGISALAGIAYRRRERAGLWLSLCILLAFVAVLMVYSKPF